jgi:hypothetical protein
MGDAAMEITEKFIDLVTRAHHYLTQRQDILRSDFRLSTLPRWDWSQDERQLVCSEKGVPRVIADIQFVGSISAETKTWLWSWANPYVEPDMWRDIAEVRQFGEAHGIAQLTTSKWTADEVDGWEMTSISAYILQAKGAYRTPREGGGFTYLIFTNIRWAQGADPALSGV